MYHMESDWCMSIRLYVEERAYTQARREYMSFMTASIIVTVTFVVAISVGISLWEWIVKIKEDREDRESDRHMRDEMKQELDALHHRLDRQGERIDGLECDKEILWEQCNVAHTIARNALCAVFTNMSAVEAVDTIEHMCACTHATALGLFKDATTTACDIEYTSTSGLCSRTQSMCIGELVLGYQHTCRQVHELKHEVEANGGLTYSGMVDMGWAQEAKRIG